MKNPIFTTKEIFEQALKALGFGVVVFVGLIKFKKEQIAISQSEFRKTIWMQKLDSYRKTAEIIGRIIYFINKDHAAFSQAANEYGSLYWGEMYLNEEKSISEQMTAFNNDLIKIRDNNVSDPESINELIRIGGLLITSMKKDSDEEFKKLQNE
jgi:hypothetical protein